MNTVTFVDVYQTSTTNGAVTSNAFNIGQRGRTPDGREWVYVLAQGAIAANYLAIPYTVTTVTAGAVTSSSDNQGRIVYINCAGQTFTAGAFANGIGCVTAGTGIGQTFKIKTNNTTTLTLYPETALTVSLGSSSALSINTMAYVQISAVTSTVQQTVGSPQVAFVAGDYGWVLTEGDGGIVASNQLVVGKGFTSGGSTAGQALVAVTATGAFDAQPLGYCIVANSGAYATLARFEIRG